MIQKLIDDAIAKERKIEHISSGKFSCGDAGKCQLMRYWKRQGKKGFLPKTEKEIENEKRGFRVFEVGHIFEQWIIGKFTQGALQTKVEDEHRKGFIDLIIYENGKQILYDIKTVHSRKFWHNKKEGWGGDRHYKCQVLTYADMLPERPESLRLAYVSKDDLCIEEVAVTGSETVETPMGRVDLATWERQDWQSLIQAWEDKKEPIPQPMSWECGWCQYREGCDFIKGKK
jgi:hypothetical protein